MKRFKAFTLAEVLITLAIIGVVAALTIPSVITKYQKRQTVVKLKTAYNILQQALIQSEIENGPHENWNYNLSSAVFFEKYIKKYINYTKYSTLSSDNFTGVDYYMKPYNASTKIPSSSNHPINSNGYPKAILNNGMIFAAGAEPGPQKCSVAVDINGVKKPNAYARDVFYLCIHKNHKSLTPFCVLPYSRSSIINHQNYGCSKTSNFGGQLCAGLIVIDGWQIKDDYPW